MEYADYNKRIINTISRDDGLLPCYLKALDDITLRYKSVRVRLWDKVERHARYTLDIEYRGHKAQVQMWGQDGMFEQNTEVMYNVVSLVSMREVALRRVFVDDEGLVKVA